MIEGYESLKIVKNVSVPPKNSLQNLPYRFEMKQNHKEKQFNNSIIELDIHNFRTVCPPQLILNNNYLCIFGEYGKESMEADIILFKTDRADDSSDRFLMEFTCCFDISTFLKEDTLLNGGILHDGKSIVTLTHINQECFHDGLKLFCLNEKMQLEFKEVLQIEGNLEYQNFELQDNKVILVFSDFVKIYDCLNEIVLINSFDFDILDLDSICMSKDSLNAVITTEDHEFIEVDKDLHVKTISNFKTLIPTLDITPVFSNSEDEEVDDFVFRKVHCKFQNCYIKKLFFESCKVVYIGITNTGLIINLANGNLIANVVKELRLDDIEIFKLAVCPANNFLYLMDTISQKIYVYHLMQKKLLSEIYVGQDTYDFSVGLNGNFLIFNCKHQTNPSVFKDSTICILPAFTNAFNLKYLSRMALLRYYSVDQLKNLNFGAKIKHMIFNDLY